METEKSKNIDGPRIGRYRRVEEISLKIMDRHYRWNGTFGSVLQSKERGVKPGDIRLIAGVLFEARRECRPFLIYFKKPTIHWTPVEYFNIEWIRAYKAAIMATD